MMRHELQMLPVEHRAKLTRAKLYQRIRRNVHHPLHTTIGRRQRNGWTAEIQECRRLVSRQLEDPRQLEIDNSAPWEQLPYHCRIDWNKEGTEIISLHPLSTRRQQKCRNDRHTISTRGRQWTRDNKRQYYNIHRLLDSSNCTK